MDLYTINPDINKIREADNLMTELNGLKWFPTRLHNLIDCWATELCIKA